MEELFIEALEILKTYGTNPSLNSVQKNNLLEAITRLEAIQGKFTEIIEQNNSMLESNEGLQKLRELMSEDSINKLMKEQAKKDPVLATYLASKGRLVKSNSSEVSVYDMSRSDDRSKENQKELTDLQDKTESIYGSLWIVKERLNQTPKFKNFESKGSRDVRNHLIQHIERKDSGASIYSFGIATNGPVLRPMKPVGAKASHDIGFKINLENFLLEIKKYSK